MVTGLCVLIIALYSICDASLEEYFPKVYILLEGYDRLSDIGPRSSVRRSGSVTLVVAGDKSIVVDTGASNHAYDLMHTLRERYGINASGVSMLVITHTHSDHYQSALLFHPAPQVIFKHEVRKDELVDTPLMDSPSWSPLGINELTILSTPGHTAGDISLIVRNFNNTQKSLAVVGDLFLHSHDNEPFVRSGEPVWTGRSDYPTVQRYYRRLIACQVDYIIPGHGPMFEVSEEMKNFTLGCYSGQATVRQQFALYLPITLVMFSVNYRRIIC